MFQPPLTLTLILILILDRDRDRNLDRNLNPTGLNLIRSDLSTVQN
jgi:hypothetical protein